MVAVLGVVAVTEDGDRLAERCPDVVEVDAGGHDADDHLERCGLRDLDLLDLECVLGLAFTLLADDPCGHRLRQRAGLHVEIRDFRYVNCHVSSTPGSFRLCRGSVSARNLPFAVRNPSEGATTFENPLWKPRRNHNLHSATSPTGPSARSETGSLSRGSTVDDRRAAEVVRDRAQAGSLPSETVRKAIEIGARVLDSEETAANVDYVRASSRPCWRPSRAARRNARGEAAEELAERLAEALRRRRDGSVQKDIEKVRRERARREPAQDRHACSRARTVPTRSPTSRRPWSAGKELAEPAAGRGSQANSRAASRPSSARSPASRARCTPTTASPRRPRSGTAQGPHLRGDGLRRHRGDRDRALRLRDAHRRRRRARRAARRATVVEFGRGGRSLRGATDRLRGKNKQLSKSAPGTELNACMASSAMPSFGVLVVAGDDQVPAGSRATHGVPGQQAHRRSSTATTRRSARAAAGLSLAAARVIDGSRPRPRGRRAEVRDATEEAVAALKRRKPDQVAHRRHQ